MRSRSGVTPTRCSVTKQAWRAIYLRNAIMFHVKQLQIKPYILGFSAAAGG